MRNDIGSCFLLLVGALLTSSSFCQDSLPRTHDSLNHTFDTGFRIDDSLSHSRDTTIIYKNQSFTLADVVVRNNLDVAAFIDYVKKDTTFYKAFRNLRVSGFSSINDITLNDKKGNIKASLHSTTTQTVSNGCRTMAVKEERTTGDFYDKKGRYNYTTAEMYAGLFFY